MSGPAESSEGRAVKANHEPSPEKAADSPTILTPEAIASDAAIVGDGVTLGVGEASTDRVGVTTGVSTGVGPGVSLAGGSEVDGVSAGLAVGSVDGVAVELGVGVTAGVGFGLGFAVGAAADGSAITTMASLPEASVPTTTASLRTGERVTDLGRIVMSTALEPRSATGAHSSCRSTAQTSLIAALSL